jgi:hypothetical protein
MRAEALHYFRSDTLNVSNYQPLAQSASMSASFHSWILLLLLGVFGAPFTQAANENPTPAARPQMELPVLGEEVPIDRIKVICAFYGLHELWRKIERDPPIRPFKSDGCSTWFNQWKGVSLYPAAFLHDLKYWAGYPSEDVERLVADAELMIDVARLLDSTSMAETMFHGVRVGGTDALNTPFSWGFGRKPLKTPPLVTKQSRAHRHAR